MPPRRPPRQFLSCSDIVRLRLHSTAANASFNERVHVKCPPARVCCRGALRDLSGARALMAHSGHNICDHGRADVTGGRCSATPLADHAQWCTRRHWDAAPQVQHARGRLDPRLSLSALRKYTTAQIQHARRRLALTIAQGAAAALSPRALHTHLCAHRT